MTDLKLIYFEGCPNAETARMILTESCRAFEEVRQDDFGEDHPFRKYTSPTILFGDRVVYGTASGDAGCSVAKLDEGAILAAIEAAVRI